VTYSVFNPEDQNAHLESKIVASLERISQVFRVLLWRETKEEALSPIQLQILIFLCFHKAEQRTVTYLAQEFNMTKATISDSVKMLDSKKLVAKTALAGDARSYTLDLTDEGRQMAQKASAFANVLTVPLVSLTQAQKETFYQTLLAMIEQLIQAGIIQPQRMCASCRFHSMNEGVHYCQLLQQTLPAADLRIDCPEHEGRG
jgi:DNA-binding MarR family transcriptional regulator